MILMTQIIIGAVDTGNLSDFRQNNGINKYLRTIFSILN